MLTEDRLKELKMYVDKDNSEFANKIYVQIQKALLMYNTTVSIALINVNNIFTALYAIYGSNPTKVTTELDDNTRKHLEDVRAQTDFCGVNIDDFLYAGFVKSLAKVVYEELKDYRNYLREILNQFTCGDLCGWRGKIWVILNNCMVEDFKNAPTFSLNRDLKTAKLEDMQYALYHSCKQSQRLLDIMPQ